MGVHVNERCSYVNEWGEGKLDRLSGWTGGEMGWVNRLGEEEEREGMVD